jgi:hypothetical protein
MNERITKAYLALNLYDKMLAFKPDRIHPYCVFCGKPAQSQHHVIPRSRLKGCADEVSPRFSVCGSGNESGCHGMLHSGRLFVRWNDGCEFLHSPEPISRDEAHARQGWEPLDERVAYFDARWAQ